MMSRLAIRLAFVLMVALCGVFSVGALAQHDSDSQAIEKAIRGQMAAFARDDATAAFAFSTPGIQALFHHDANSFLASVKHAYQPVYRPGDLFFMAPEKHGDHFIQQVKIGMPDGKVWIAHYDMRKQSDNRWLINGCQLELASEIST
jgi:hypothetical protein